MRMSKPLMRLLRSSLSGAVGALLPERCPSCGEQVQGAGLGQPVSLCPACFMETRRVQEPNCDHCGWPKEHAEDVCFHCDRLKHISQQRFPLVYGDAATRLILRLKHGDRPEIARRLALWMAQSGTDVLAHADVMIPVPVHWSRLWMRQYNQAAEITRYIAAQTDVPWEAQVLRRIRATPSQGHRSLNQRRANVSKAFAVSLPSRIQGRNVLLIDDVVTTGATAEACAKCLLDAGAARVDLLIAAAVSEK